MTQRPPDFDELIGGDLTPTETDRLRHVHDLLLEAGPPPELSPEFEQVQWPDEALAPLTLRSRSLRERSRRSPLLVAAVLLTAAAIGFVFGQTTGSKSNTAAIDTQHVVKLRGTALNRGALATLQLGNRDREGNWPMLLHVTGLRPLPEGGYYDLYLTFHGKPVALCGSFNANSGDATISFTAAYELGHFDRDGWVVTRQVPPNHKPTQIVLRPVSGPGSA
jgi:hypothetical protein